MLSNSWSWLLCYWFQSAKKSINILPSLSPSYFSCIAFISSSVILRSMDNKNTAGVITDKEYWPYRMRKILLAFHTPVKSERSRLTDRDPVAKLGYRCTWRVKATWCKIKEISVTDRCSMACSGSLSLWFSSFLLQARLWRRPVLVTKIYLHLKDSTQRKGEWFMQMPC